MVSLFQCDGALYAQSKGDESALKPGQLVLIQGYHEHLESTGAAVALVLCTEMGQQPYAVKGLGYDTGFGWAFSPADQRS